MAFPSQLILTLGAVTVMLLVISWGGQGVMAAPQLARYHMLKRQASPPATSWHCKMLCMAECSTWVNPDLGYCTDMCVESKKSGNTGFDAKYYCKGKSGYYENEFF